MSPYLIVYAGWWCEGNLDRSMCMYMGHLGVTDAEAGHNTMETVAHQYSPMNYGTLLP